MMLPSRSLLGASTAASFQSFSFPLPTTHFGRQQPTIGPWHMIRDTSLQIPKMRIDNLLRWLVGVFTLASAAPAQVEIREHMVGSRDVTVIYKNVDVTTPKVFIISMVGYSYHLRVTAHSHSSRRKQRSGTITPIQLAPLATFWPKILPSRACLLCSPTFTASKMARSARSPRASRKSTLPPPSQPSCSLRSSTSRRPIS